MPDERLTVEVRGLRDLQRALRQVDRTLGPELRKGLNEAAEIVVRTARPLVPRRTGAAAASLRAGSTQRVAAVRAGGNRVPYYGWLDFGGNVGRGDSVRRPFIREGRYVYPSLRRERRAVLDSVDDAVARVARRAGFETSGSGVGLV